MEDDDALRDALVELLRLRGHAVLGLRRFDLATLDAIPPADVWVVDHALPGRSGGAIVRTLRKAGTAARSPVVIGMSADRRAEADFKAAGADLFLSKPFGLAELGDAIERAGSERHPTPVPRAASRPREG